MRFMSLALKPPVYMTHISTSSYIYCTPQELMLNTACRCHNVATDGYLEALDQYSLQYQFTKTNLQSLLSSHDVSTSSGHVCQHKDMNMTFLRNTTLLCPPCVTLNFMSWGVCVGSPGVCRSSSMLSKGRCSQVSARWRFSFSSVWHLEIPSLPPTHTVSFMTNTTPSAVRYHHYHYHPPTYTVSVKHH